MSINGTVKGDPINISDKKKSVGVSNDANNEIKKRRQMRLQQVRQQSKDIAQTIRDKVKKESEKQISQASHENATRLKQWQNQKLLHLQHQYQEGLNDIGLGHMQAADEEKREDDALVERDKRKKDVKERGFQASQKLQIAKNEHNMKKALPRQQKQFARDVENTRASLVSNLKKSPEKINGKQKHTETALSFPESFVDLDYIDGETLEEPTDETPTTGTESPSVVDSLVVTTTIKSPKQHRYKNVPPVKGKITPIESEPQTWKSSVQDTLTNQTSEEENHISNPAIETTEARTREFHLDTRISDRIKRRLLPFPEMRKPVCGLSNTSEYNPTKNVCCPCPGRNAIDSTSTFDKDKSYNLDTCNIQIEDTSKSTTSKSIISNKMAASSIKNDKMATLKNQPKLSQHTKNRNTMSTLSYPSESRAAHEKGKRIEIPLKPSVALIPSSETLSHLHSLPPQPTNISKVQSYDHRNRYNTEYLTDNANIQRIADENILELSEPNNSAMEDTELMHRRDREAQIRGQKALEKEKIQREYNELLQKLPILQRQERIACICRDKPTFHMNKERLQEVEIKRQNIMENAYENLFPNIVTLPPKLKVIPDPNNMPFVTIHNPDTTSMRSGTGDMTNELRRGLDEQQTNLLQILLQNLQQQKEMLQQLGSTSAEQNLNVLDNASEGKKSSKKSIPKSLSEYECVPVKALILQNMSTQTSPAQTSGTSSKITNSSPKRPHKSLSNEVDGCTSPKKAKKLRNKIETKTNISASATVDNTTYKSSLPSDTTDSSIPVRISKASNRKHPCECKSQAKCNELCEIRIRIQENEQPEIIISSPKKSSRAEISSAKPMFKVPSHTEPHPLPVSRSSYNDRKRSKTAHKSTPKRVAAIKGPITWGDHLTQHSSSSSTTYYSPPTIQHNKSLKLNETKGIGKSKCTTDSSSASNKQIDRRLMTYISKLLDLSKAQVDELSVSSVSEVTTPNSSVVDCSNNRPMKQLMNVMKLFKLSPVDIATNLNYSKDSLPGHTSNSNSTRSSGGYDASKSLQTDTTKNQVQFSGTTDSSKYNSDSSKATTNESDGFVTKYTEMADVCHRRISDLTAEIEKIRQEKQKILESHSESDKENSTVYSNLPLQFGPHSTRTVSPHLLEEQEELNKKLLRIKSPTQSGPIAVDVGHKDFFRGVLPLQSGPHSTRTVSPHSLEEQEELNKKLLRIKSPTQSEPIAVDVGYEDFFRGVLPLQFGPHSTRTVSPHSLEEQELNKKLLRIKSPTQSGPIAVDVGYEDFSRGVDDIDQDIMDRYIKLKTDVNNLIVNEPEIIVESSQLSQAKKKHIQFNDKLMPDTISPTDLHVGEEIDSRNVVDNADIGILDAISSNKSDTNKFTVEVPGPTGDKIEDTDIISETRQDLFFVPLLEDIPRLPKLGTPISLEIPTNQGKRPPPSKGLIAARKFKGDIIAAPHELSTIAEAESIISTKINLKQTPDESFVESSKSSVERNKSNGNRSSSSSSSSEETMPDLLAELIGKVNVTDDFKGDITKRSDTDTSTEKSDLETIENMLRSIGMDWAIATLRKTRETLGRNSSSSSNAEISGKQLDDQTNDCACFTRLEASISGSSNNTASQYSSPACCSASYNGIDVSQVSDGTRSSKIINNCNRTSTPVQKSKRRTKSTYKESIFTGESDLSSVVESKDNHYLTIPELSLKSHNRTE